MSFDKHYPNRKDWRKPYRGSKRFDRTCRNHGSCSYCEANRTFNRKRQTESLDADFKTFLTDNDSDDDLTYPF